MFLNMHHGYPFHLKGYCDALKIHHWSFDYLVLKDNDQIKSSILVQKRKLPFIPMYLIFIPFAPIGDDKDINEILIDYVIQTYQKKSLKMTLQLQDDQMIKYPQFKYHKSYYTYFIDLTKDSDLRFNLYSKTFRNCIRKAIKDDVKVSFVTDSKDIDELIKTYDLMLERKDIEGIDQELMKAIMIELISSNQGFIAKTVYQGIDYNYAFIVINGSYARYLYGASKTQIGIPPMGQFLHHEIMNELYTRGIKTYDLGGISNIEVKEDDPSYGVYKFKKGFGGKPVNIATEYVYKRIKFL